MAFKDLDLKLSYETDEQSSYLLKEFYVPLLQNANKYYRIAGFFSSTSLIIASKGIQGLINNGGKMLLLISPELSEDDYNIIKHHSCITEECSFFSDLELGQNSHDNLKALAWMLDSGNLEIKIAVPVNAGKGLFHQKIGIAFDDSGDIVSFSGSINETAQAWLNNIEEFKVFKSWESGQKEYVMSDLSKFLSYWKNNKQNVAQVYDIPEAIKEKIISIKPRDIHELDIMNNHGHRDTESTNELGLFPHQLKAVKAWKENNYRLMMEMATGTGKTRTAIGCINELLKEETEKLCVIISVPQDPIRQQWINDIKELNIPVDKTLEITGQKWRLELELLLLDLYDNKINSAIVFTIHKTASSDDFIKIIRRNNIGIKFLFIGDEVHALGANKQKNALLEEYDYRIGLSATPERMFDDKGTRELRAYFGDKAYEFSIKEALNTENPLTGRPFLNRYCYCPVFVELTEGEDKKYANFTKQIAIMKESDDCDEKELEKLYNKRAVILKNAENKIDVLDALIETLNPKEIKDTIIFWQDDNHVKQVFSVLHNKNIKRAKITGAENPDERQQIISQFKKHQLQVLVGIKCLDEGIDIKSARIAILMSSSTNPREYIQRVGRVIRDAPNKEESVIYDFIVSSASNPDIIAKEARRVKSISENATNYEDVKAIFMNMGVDLDANQ